MSDFKAFSRAVDRRFADMRSGDLYTVDAGDLFDAYLASFPEGTNPLFRKRTEHDCSCCRGFIKNVGHVVSIEDGQVRTIWDGLTDLPHPYDVVAARLAETVRSSKVTGVFKTTESKFGAETTREMGENGSVINWSHFHCDLANAASKHRTTAVGELKGNAVTAYGVITRAMTDFSAEAVATVKELVDAGSVYKAADYKSAVSAFAKTHSDYHALPDERSRELLVWTLTGNNQIVNFKNSSIGSLVEDLSYGEDLEKAVKSFESKVAPQNYKRPTAVVSQRMIDDAIKALREAGLEESIPRRHAKLSDVPVTDVLFVDNSVRGSMLGGFLEDVMANAAQSPAPELKNPTEIAIDEFVTEVLPKVKSVSLLLEGTHLGNFVSLTAPVNPTAPLLFKWGNGFAWSYDGDVADSIKEKVKRAGGNVNAPFRVSLSWHNADDLDLHCSSPQGHIYYRDRKGVLDVDMNGMDRHDSENPVENMSWKSLKDGTYRFSVHQFSRRRDVNIGFTVELFVEGQSTYYDFSKAVRQDQTVPVVDVVISNGKVSKVTPSSEVKSSNGSVEKWGVKTTTLVPVEVIANSPNHWRGESVGSKHWIFALKDCKNPDPVRGIYNEFLRPELDKHRKVLEILGARTKAPYSPDQISGVGFSSGRGDVVSVHVSGPGLNRSYRINF